jgi:hypothetical protein
MGLHLHFEKYELRNKSRPDTWMDVSEVSNEWSIEDIQKRRCVFDAILCTIRRLMCVRTRSRCSLMRYFYSERKDMADGCP